jgi:hypothetical protein
MVLPAVEPFVQRVEDMLRPVVQLVQERLSATVQASKMPAAKLEEVRKAFGGSLYAMEGSGELLSKLLGPEPEAMDPQFDWSVPLLNL